MSDRDKYNWQAEALESVAGEYELDGAHGEAATAYRKAVELRALAAQQPEAVRSDAGLGW